MSESQKEPANESKSFDHGAMNTTKEVWVKQNQLPLSCPMDASAIWCSHPKVSLPIESAGKEGVTCPYCGPLYRLQNGL